MEIAFAIAAAEITFWALLVAGMAARYWWRRRRLSTILLAVIPLADALLLALAAIDLGRGAEAEWSHGLAAVYLGFSIAFGPLVIAETDRRVARRARPEPIGEWSLWLRCVLASAIAAAVLGALTLLADEPSTLFEWFGRLGVVTVGWFVFGPLWSGLSPRRRQPTT